MIAIGRSILASIASTLSAGCCAVIQYQRYRLTQPIPAIDKNIVDAGNEDDDGHAVSQDSRQPAGRLRAYREAGSLQSPAAKPVENRLDEGAAAQKQTEHDKSPMATPALLKMPSPSAQARRTIDGPARGALFCQTTPLLATSALILRRDTTIRVAADSEHRSIGQAGSGRRPGRTRRQAMNPPRSEEPALRPDRRSRE